MESTYQDIHTIYGSVYGVILHENLEELSSFVFRTDLKFQKKKHPILKSLMIDIHRNILTSMLH